MKYFAYGSNMNPNTITSICGDNKFLGRARLDGYRLAFTRQSVKTHSGVADIVLAPNLVVWGALYEIEDDCLFKLDQKEGYGSAYTRTAINVTLFDDNNHQAIAYTVMEKESKETPPSGDYLSKLIDGAKNCEINPRYCEFLESLASEDSDNFRAGLLVEPTQLRIEAHGMPLVRISESLQKDYPSKHLGVVLYRDKMCPAKFAHDPLIPANTCQLDQSIRHALGIKGRHSFGAFIQLASSQKRFFSFPLISPRVLVLPMYRSSVLDVEKQTCILNQRNVKLLGIEEGNYVRIHTVVKDKQGKFLLQRISRRVFSGETSILRGKDQIKDYPKPDEFYLDLDGRLALGLGRDDIEIPILISPDIRRLFTSRILYYGITLFLGLLALFPIIQQIVNALRLPTWIESIGSLSLALVITVMLTWLDLREKVQY